MFANHRLKEHSDIFVNARSAFEYLTIDLLVLFSGALQPVVVCSAELFQLFAFFDEHESGHGTYFIFFSDIFTLFNVHL